MASEEPEVHSIFDQDLLNVCPVADLAEAAATANHAVLERHCSWLSYDLLSDVLLPPFVLLLG